MRRSISLLFTLLWSGGFTFLMASEADGEGAPSADPAVYLAEVVKLLDRQWPANRTVTIVCHGHSVPAGYFKTPVVDSFNAYPHLLHRALKERYPHAVINVIVTAIGGENSEAGALRFEEDVLCHKPDLVTIDYSLNDRGLGVDKARKAWSSMIASAEARGVKVILLTPTADVGSNLEDPMDPLNQHAEMVRRLAAEHEVGLADSLTKFKAYVSNQGGQLADLMSQGNHPNRRGHDLVVEALRRWFPESRDGTGGSRAL